MNKLYLTLVSLVFSLSSWTSWSQPLVLSPLESLRSVLPFEVSIRPKLSLRENLTTIFAELSTYARTTAARPDSNNLVSGWTARQDQQLLETILIHRESFLSEGADPLLSFFSKRIAKASQVRPFELWESYYLVSKLFPDNKFWVPFYENILKDSILDWSKIPNPEWIATTLLPSMANSKSSNSKWNKTLLLNLLGFVKEQSGRFNANRAQSTTTSSSSFGDKPLGGPSSQILARALISAIEVTDNVFSFSDSRLQELGTTDTLELQQTYFEFLQSLIPQLNQGVILGAMAINPVFASTLLESTVMNAFILGTQTHKMYVNLDSPRVKAFLGRHDQEVQWLNKHPKETQPTKKFRQALSTAYYLRTLISLKSHLTNYADVISKGQWINNKQFQRGMEALWYEELIAAQSETLGNIQLTIYTLSLVDKCYRERLLTPMCHKWRTLFPMQLKEWTNDKGIKESRWELQSQQPIVLPPGQIVFSAKEHLRIIAPEVIFSPLTRLVIPSGRVEIQTNKISFPWIDVSGRDALDAPPSPGFAGQRPWIKNSQACAPRDYIEGTNLMTLPGKNKPKWVGFSMENPFASNIFICSSHAQMANKDLVGDIQQMIDLGQAPELPNQSIPLHGNAGGQIKIEIGSANEREPVLLPLLVAMGGDGSPGIDGQSSPLCNQGFYQSFKIGLSHHKDWFQKWLNYQGTNPHLRLITKSEYEDHWYGLFEVNLPRSSGSDGGNAGPGGQITLAVKSGFESRPHRWFLSAGVPGEGGKAGNCGPNEVTNGKTGQTSHSGLMNLLRQ